MRETKTKKGPFRSVLLVSTILHYYHKRDKDDS